MSVFQEATVHESPKKVSYGKIINVRLILHADEERKTESLIYNFIENLKDLENLTNIPDVKCFHVKTLFNWNDVKTHKTFGQAMKEVQGNFKKENECIISYFSTESLSARSY